MLNEDHLNIGFRGLPTAALFDWQISWIARLVILSLGLYMTWPNSRCLFDHVIYPLIGDMAVYCTVLYMRFPNGYEVLYASGTAGVRPSLDLDNGSKVRIPPHHDAISHVTNLQIPGLCSSWYVAKNPSRAFPISRHPSSCRQHTTAFLTP